MSDPNIIPDRRKNYLYMINAAVGTTMFRHLYVADRRTKKAYDALDDGDLSCAYMVSCILALHRLIDSPHATVDTTIKQMLEARWSMTNRLAIGAVVRWPAGEHGHSHLGFYVAENTCISNSADKKVPVKHGLVLHDGREPDAFFLHAVLHTRSAFD